MSKVPFSKYPHVVILGAGASIACSPEGDIHGHMLPDMNNFVEIVGLASILKDEKIPYKCKNFGTVYNNLVKAPENVELVNKIDEIIYDYFSKMELSKEATIYDYLVLALGKKDLIATFNWDPFLAQAYSRNTHIEELPQIAFLHGNVAAGVCYEDYQKGYSHEHCPSCKSTFKATPLLYPTKKNNYTKNKFIKNEWDMLKAYLNDAYLLTIFGYSAPDSDKTAKEIMRNTWRNNSCREIGEINIVDIKNEEVLEKTWNNFFCKSRFEHNRDLHHYEIYKDIFESFLFRYPRRSCEAFSSATLMNDPLPLNPFHKFDKLEDLQNWVQNLVEEAN